MTKLITVLISWLKMSPLSLASFGRRIVLFMEPLAIFALPPTMYVDILRACTRIETAWANRKNGPVAKKELENSVTDFDVILHGMASFVDEKALGSETIIISSGFTPTKTAGVPSVIPDDPDAPTLEPIRGGILDVLIKHQNGVTHNVIVVFLGLVFDLPIVDGHFVIPAGSAGVVIMPIAHTHEQISGLPKGAEVTVVVFSYNSAGLSGASNPTKSYII